MNNLQNAMTQILDLAAGTWAKVGLAPIDLRRTNWRTAGFGISWPGCCIL
jgi:hypothetical protein